jgi:predicted nucleic acid-binding protein
MTEEDTPAHAWSANSFILFFEGVPAVSDRVKMRFEVLRGNPGRGVTSELTLAEVLAQSDRPRWPILKRAYLDLVVWSQFIDLVPVTRSILYESAELRAAHRSAHGRKLDLPDAIHLTTAIQKKCRFFVSGDEGIEPPDEMIKLSPIKGSLDEVLKVFE